MTPNKAASPRTETAVQRVAAPTFLTPYLDGDTSTEKLIQHRILPRLHPLDDGEEVLKDALRAHGVASVIMVPSNILVAKAEERFKFVPFFFFPEYLSWRDRKDKGGGRRVTERTYDENSDLARKAKDERRRVEAYGPADPQTGQPSFKMSHVEYLRFAGILYDHPELHGEPCVVSFAKGNHFQGASLISAMATRKVPNSEGERVIAPCWSTVWELWGEETANAEGSWSRFGFSAPTDGSSPWIREEESEKFRAEHQLLRKQYAEKILTTADEGEGEDGEVKTDF